MSESGVPPNSVLFGGTVPPNSVLFGGTVPPNSVLFGGTIPPNSFPLTNLQPVVSIANHCFQFVGFSIFCRFLQALAYRACPESM